MINNVTVCLISIASLAVLHAGDFDANKLSLSAGVQSRDVDLKNFAGDTRSLSDRQNKGFRLGGSTIRNEPRLYAFETRLPNDPVSVAKMEEQIMIAREKQNALEVKIRQAMQKRQFEAKFNQLANALAGFAKQYNEGKGTTWPQHEADKLRDAMRQLQSVEKSLRDDSRTAAAREKRGSNASSAR